MFSLEFVTDTFFSIFFTSFLEDYVWPHNANVNLPKQNNITPWIQQHIYLAFHQAGIMGTVASSVWMSKDGDPPPLQKN